MNGERTPELLTHRLSFHAVADVTEADLVAHLERMGLDPAPFLSLPLGKTHSGVTRIALVVPSDSGVGEYVLRCVPMDGDRALSCTCKAFAHGRGALCKHLRRALEGQPPTPRMPEPLSQRIARQQRIARVTFDGAVDGRVAR